MSATDIDTPSFFSRADKSLPVIWRSRRILSMLSPIVVATSAMQRSLSLHSGKSRTWNGLDRTE